MDISVIKKRIQKLLALSGSPNEAEAALAMSKCHELMEKYGIRTIDVDEATKSVDVEMQNLSSIYKTHQVWEVHLANVIATSLDTEFVFSKNSSGISTLFFIGTPTDMMFVIDLFKRLRRIISKQAKEYTIGERKKKTLEYSYKMGFIDIVQTRLISLYKNLSDCTALVPVKQDAVKKALKDAFPKIKRSRVQSPQDRDAYFAGAEDGKKVNLNRSLSNNNTKTIGN
jgi:hypothetical protein